MASESDVEIAAACVIVIGAVNRLSKRKKRLWVRPYLQKRSQHSGKVILEDLKKDELAMAKGDLKLDSFRGFVRMSSSDFEHLIGLVGPKIAGNDTNYRAAITVPEKLAVTLRFLATGCSYNDLMLLFRISVPCISKFIPEVLDALVEALKENVKVSINTRTEGYHYQMTGFVVCIPLLLRSPPKGTCQEITLQCA